MKNQILKLSLFSLITATLVAMPAVVRAEDKPVTPEPPATPAKIVRQTFHGKVDAVDAAKMTLTVGSLTLNVTSDTKISKHGKPATLSEIVVGDMVGGSSKKDEAGKLNATIIRVADTAKMPKKPKKADKPEAAPK